MSANVPFRMNLIPPWTLEGPAGTIEIPNRKVRAILACLALSPGQSLAREGLATLLWHNSDSHKARGSLRQALAVLNRLLAPLEVPLVNAKGDRLELVPGALVCDLDIGLAAIRRGRPDAVDAARLAGLPDLMADLTGGGVAFDDWVARRRAESLALASQNLKTLFRDPAHPAPVRSRAAQLAFALDDLDEDALRCLLEIHVESGNSAAALRLYGAFYRRLQDEMDAEPSAQTLDLVVRIKLEEQGDRPTPAAASPPGPARSAATAPRPTVTVAVLPFEVLAHSPLPDYVRIGLLDQITCLLAACPAPAVISSNSTRRYLDCPPEPEQVARDLRATYVVSGSVMVQQGEAAVSVQLVETATAHVVWAGVFRRPVDELFNLRADIASAVAGVILPSVDMAELRRIQTAEVGTQDPYHQVLRAKDLIFRLDRAAFDVAGGILRDAVVLSPQFAPAQALLAEWHALRHWQSWGPDPDADRAAVRLHAGRAIALSPGDGRVIALWAHCRMLFDRDYSGALRLLENALQMRPNDSETLVWSAPTLAYAGQAERAVQQARRAMDLSPLDPFRFRNEHFLSLTLYCHGEYNEAAELGLASFARVPDLSSNLRMTIAALVAAGRAAEAEPLVAHHMAIQPAFSVAAFVPQHRLADARARAIFGERLVTAGLPREAITPDSR